MARRERGPWRRRAPSARRGRSGLELAMPGARFSKHAYWGRKMTCTLPVGPLRCLPMMTSAIVPPSVATCRSSVQLRPVEEEDDVGVLLEGARLAKVGELRLLALRGPPPRGRAGTARPPARSAPWRAP